VPNSILSSVDFGSSTVTVGRVDDFVAPAAAAAAAAAPCGGGGRDGGVWN